MKYFLNTRSIPLLALFLFVLPLSSRADKLKTAYEALAEYDYFKARKLFYEINKKSLNAEACYGLAYISMRTDNPFHHLDSACKYINAAYHSYIKLPIPFVGSGFQIDSLQLRKLADTISYQCLQKAKQTNNARSCDHFLLNNYLGRKKYIYEVIYLRDEIEYKQATTHNSSDSTRQFIITHPQSIFLKEAQVIMDRQLFEEQTKSGTAEEYTVFITKHPHNVMLNTAYEKLFAIHKTKNDTKGLADFVKKYPRAPQNLEAWKLLYSLTVKSYSYSELKKFIDDYPDFPLKNSILKDLELNKLVLFAVQIGDYTGYVDENGTLKIPATYDEAGAFYEGLAVVSRNDSVYFINKENENGFRHVYSFATDFRNGVAAVKLGNKAFFINRQGQSISKNYDEISEISDQTYVLSVDGKFGAADQYGQIIIEPTFQKLGDFKNGFAYYTEEGLYGFVARNGTAHKAEFEWISDFDENGLATYRLQGKYGLVNTAGKKLLAPLYDLVITASDKNYIVVSNNKYGFYNADACYVSQVIYDYQKEKPADYYTNGSLYRLLRKADQALMDKNGRMILNYGLYEDFGFPNEGFIRVKKKSKSGYLDLKLSPAIPVKYMAAEDFKGGLAIVHQKEKNILIDASGKEIYLSPGEITRINAQFYLVELDESTFIINRAGDVVAADLLSYKVLEDGRILLVFKTGEIRLLSA